MARYPAKPTARDRFILERRSGRPAHDPWRAQGQIVEQERTAEGTLARTATIFLTGRECPWRCAMCDLWQYTTTTDTPPGAIAAQIAQARRTLDADVIKLYNAGSFFDPHAVPEHDYNAIATELSGVSRVIVESHPTLVGGRTARFLDALNTVSGAGLPSPALEVAIGLETAHPEALEGLNKRMTVDDLTRAAAWLRQAGVALRVFLLVSPPFIEAAEQDRWLQHSVDVAQACGSSAISLIPTRGGNGTLEALAADGRFHPPRLEDLERSLELALAQVAGAGVRVFADLWDLHRFSDCPQCFAARQTRLQTINLTQRLAPQTPCHDCGFGHPA